MLEIYEQMADRMDEDNYREYLRLTRELQDREDRRAELNASAIRYLGDSIRELSERVLNMKRPTVINLLITDPSNSKIKDFVDNVIEIDSE